MIADLDRTLEDLENERWGTPEIESHLVTECHRLRKIPLSEFTTENLRIMIGQGLSLQHLMPVALSKLADNPFAEGDFFAGDLLQTVLRTEWMFWEGHPDLFAQLQAIMSEVEQRLEFAKRELLPAWQSFFR